MGFAENMRIMSNINCGLASLVSYGQARVNGVPSGYAAIDLVGNVANGAMRNEWAYGMQKMGNPVGNVINSYAGYGNPVSNAIGTIGLMSCTPLIFFNCYSPIMGFNMNYYVGSGLGFYC